MEFNNAGELLLTHHMNLVAVSRTQLAAVKQGDFGTLDDLGTQKQMIIEQINGVWADGFSLEQCHPDIRLKIRKTILENLEIEEELKLKVAHMKDAVKRELISLRQENKLTEKYGLHAETSLFLDESR